MRHSLVRSIIGLLVLMVAVPLMAQSADLTATKSGPATAAADTDVTYDITVVNLGPDDATAASLTDVIPAGMTFVSFSQPSGPPFTCSSPGVGFGGTVSCTLATFAAGGSATFSLVVHIPPGTPPGTTFTNIATASSPIDPNAENDSSAASTTTPAPPQADVGVTKTGPSSALSNSDVSYTISVTNSGPGDAQSVAFADTLPGTMTFVTLTQNSGPTFVCSTPAAGSGGTVTCSIATFIAGAEASFTLVGHIPSGTVSGTAFNNFANVSASTSDPSPENNSSTTGLTVVSADVAVAKSGPPTATAGTNIAYTIDVSNGGPDAADNVELTDVLPSGTTFVSLTQNSGLTASCSTGGTVVCSFGTMAAGATAQFTLVVTTGSGTAAGSTISNTASVTSTADPNGSNNSSTVSTTISTSADVGVAKSGQASVAAGASLTYTLTVSSAGPSDAQNVTLSDTLPANTTFVSLTQTGGPAFTCSTPAVGSAGTVSCGPRSLAAGASATFTLIVAVNSSTASGTTITNTATVSATADTNAANNSASASSTVTNSADLAVAKNGPATGLGSSNITYTVSVTNNGPSNAAAVAMSDALPANVTFVSLTQTTGPTFACTAPAAGATGTINCSIASFITGASATFNITVTLPPAGATVTNTATVSSGTPEANAANNSSSVTTTVSSSSADVSITKTGSPAVLPNGTATFTITVTNAGPTSALNVTVTDVLPAGTTFVSATPSQGSCSGTSTVTCNLGTLAVSASATIQLVIQASAPIGATVSNTATVSSITPDPVPTNNSATAMFFVVASIPALSPLALLMLSLMLASVALVTLRMR